MSDLCINMNQLDEGEQKHSEGGVDIVTGGQRTKSHGDKEGVDNVAFESNESLKAEERRSVNSRKLSTVSKANATGHEKISPEIDQGSTVHDINSKPEPNTSKVEKSLVNRETITASNPASFALHKSTENSGNQSCYGSTLATSDSPLSSSKFLTYTPHLLGRILGQQLFFIFFPCLFILSYYSRGGGKETALVFRPFLLLFLPTYLSVIIFFWASASFKQRAQNVFKWSTSIIWLFVYTQNNFKLCLV